MQSCLADMTAVLLLKSDANFALSYFSWYITLT